MKAISCPLLRRKLAKSSIRERGTLQGQTARYNTGVLQSTFDQPQDLVSTWIAIARPDPEQVEDIRRDFPDRPDDFNEGRIVAVWSFSPKFLTFLHGSL